MPQATRARTRAVREHAQRRKIPYTKAHEELQWVQELLDDGEFETFDEGVAFVSDERNHVMCQRCGWTWGMVCPECIPGCGCNNGRCSGWRHAEDEMNDPREDHLVECEECGGEYDARTGPNGYDCTC